MDTIPIRHINHNSQSEAPENIVVWKLDELLAGKDLLMQLHRHSFYFILLILKGSGKHIIDFVPYQVYDRSVFILRPGQLHELSLAHDVQGFLLRISEDFYFHADDPAKKTLRDASKTNFYRPEHESIRRIDFFIRSIAREISEKQSMYQQAIQLNLQLFLIELLRQENTSQLSSDVADRYGQQQLEAFKDLVVGNFAVQKQVSWYADQLHLSVYQLNKITKDELDKTASSVISDYILLEAKRYLTATSNQINQISWYLGYQDVSYFIRFFKKHTGFSPEAFRANLK